RKQLHDGAEVIVGKRVPYGAEFRWREDAIAGYLFFPCSADDGVSLCVSLRHRPRIKGREGRTHPISGHLPSRSFDRVQARGNIAKADPFYLQAMKYLRVFEKVSLNVRIRSRSKIFPL